jgi:hypothetical protein
MKIKSEKQFSKLHEPSAEGGSGLLPFDPEKYRKYLAETGWSEKVQDECLETLSPPDKTTLDLWDSSHRTGRKFRILKFLVFTESYEARPANAQEVASLRGESSNQLLETLEEWNDYLERQIARTSEQLP